MKWIFLYWLYVMLLLVLLPGCAATPVPYDEQFATMRVKDATGKVRPIAWEIGPSRTQAIRAMRGSK